MNEDRAAHEILVFVCTNHRDDGSSCCSLKGSEGIRDALKRLTKERGIADRVRVCKAGCLGQCAVGPNVVIEPAHVWLRGVTEADIPAILDRISRNS